MYNRTHYLHTLTDSELQDERDLAVRDLSAYNEYDQGREGYRRVVAFLAAVDAEQTRRMGV